MDSIKIADLGCKQLGTLRSAKTTDPVSKKKLPKYTISPELQALWATKIGPIWRDNKEAQLKLGEAFFNTAKENNLKGFALIDTMRKGSDYWRPGNLISRSFDITDELATEAGTAVNINYHKVDLYCPSKGLLEEFMQSDMSFNEYAQRYYIELKQSGVIEHAVVTTVMSLADKNCRYIIVEIPTSLVMEKAVM